MPSMFAACSHPSQSWSTTQSCMPCCPLPSLAVASVIHHGRFCYRSHHYHSTVSTVSHHQYPFPIVVCHLILRAVIVHCPLLSASAAIIAISAISAISCHHLSSPLLLSVHHPCKLLSAIANCHCHFFSVAYSCATSCPQLLCLLSLWTLSVAESCCCHCHLLSASAANSQPCENILSGYLCVVKTVFGQQDGISSFKFPKRNSEISCRDVTSLFLFTLN